MSYGDRTVELRELVADRIEGRREALTNDLADTLRSHHAGVREHRSWEHVADLLVGLIIASVRFNGVDAETPGVADLLHSLPGGLSTGEIFEAVHCCERTILDELAVDEVVGALSEGWGAVAQLARRGSFMIVAALADRRADRSAEAGLRDQLTTLLARPVFEIALAHEINRSLRHEHPLSLILFDVDDLAGINTHHGPRVGDQVLERSGILVKRFFRNHDWVARHNGDSIAVLLPETAVETAADLAERVRRMIEQRLALVDYRTDRRLMITISAAVVGTNSPEHEFEAAEVLRTAEDAVARAKHTGIVERVELLATAVTLLGAAGLLNCPLRVIRRLVRHRQVAAVRRGRHYYIDRGSLERYQAGL